MSSNNQESDRQDSKNGVVGNIELPDNNLPDQITSEEPRCFVCDVKVQGRNYLLATCRTQRSRSRIIEKLGELVGEKYMVVISEDDVICRCCANLMNTLDRLENEMQGVRSTILRFLEQKYSLEDGELLSNSDTVKPCQPPQITKSEKSSSGGYHGRKRAAVCSSEPSSDWNKQKKSNNVWMQCDKCRYTTRYNTFMAHHIRPHIKQRSSCEKCGVQISPQQVPHFCQDKSNQLQNSVLNQVDETKELPILATSMEAFSENPLPNSNGQKEQNSITVLHPNLIPEDELKQENVQLIQLAGPDDIQIENIITSDATRSGHEVYVRVLQQVDDEERDSSMEVATCTSGEMMMKMKDGTGKQMLTLAEDGSLEMVEVTSWDDIHTSQPDPDMHF
ncbi:uncharacterized protein LOC105693800 [Athalia rosae]|uniref:uncharacterized protein LOC105693800 n=1 Tax=Athalia rosae TaxID=37344 RepID=UPI002034A7A9|nr:uncharacterized protein LOC105693800 [Athalia rosae]XP_020712527.2 uncharacterized protein LOC105693800 [Athalia rosae]